MTSVPGDRIYYERIRSGCLSWYWRSRLSFPWFSTGAKASSLVARLEEFLEFPTRLTDLRRKLKLALYAALLATVVLYPLLLILIWMDGDISEKERFYFILDGAVWFALVSICLVVYNL